MQAHGPTHTHTQVIFARVMCQVSPPRPQTHPHHIFPSHGPNSNLSFPDPRFTVPDHDLSEPTLPNRNFLRFPSRPQVSPPQTTTYQNPGCPTPQRHHLQPMRRPRCIAHRCRMRLRVQLQRVRFARTNDVFTLLPRVWPRKGFASCNSRTHLCSCGDSRRCNPPKTWFDALCWCLLTDVYSGWIDCTVN
jgi:hypothetical protein